MYMTIKMSCPECGETVDLMDGRNMDFVRGRIKCPNFHRFDSELIMTRSISEINEMIKINRK